MTNQEKKPSPLYSPKFGRLYAWGCLAILGSTTFLWSYLGAKLQGGNADQLANSYLFKDAATFRGASFPGQHTFLLKWPLFFLIKLFGVTDLVLIAFTVAVTLLTVGLLAYLLYRIERRPYVFGTLCLALASVLLLVPAVPYAGALLPVNMAMMATRNLEYVLFIAGLAVIVRSPRIKTRTFWLAVGLLGLLIASDKLFLSLSIAGSLVAMIGYALTRRWRLVTVSLKWLMATVGAFLLAASLIWLVNAGGWTHIVSQSGLGPYGLVNSAKNLVLGGLYSILGILTNFGANPAYDALVVRSIPKQGLTRLLSLSGLSFMLNAIICGAAVFATFRLLASSLLRKQPRHASHKGTTKLALLMSWASLAAIVLFVASNHYYAVDARYLAITLFSGFIVLALVSSKHKWKPRMVVISGAVLALGIVGALPGVLKTYQQNVKALAIVNQRNDLLAQVLDQRRVNLLVGDYWRVLPAKQQSKGRLDVMPLEDCTHARSILSSQTWQPSLKHQGFAYLISYDQKLTDYPQCSLEQVTSYYGRPNASVIVDGTFDHPKEMLLFYDKGIRTNSAPPSKARLSTTEPISLSEIPYSTCSQPTVMNIVAHQDDDLLFLSPDLLQNIASGYCIRTVYLTAGDAGADDFYWLGRQKGSEAAYSQMIGSQELWVERVVKLGTNQYVTIANPRGNPNITLIFMHLPDGNLNGQGFRKSQNESLANLEAGRMLQIHTVDKQSSYTDIQLVNSLTLLMQAYQPTEIDTQADLTNKQFPDHSDHLAVARYTKKAYLNYEKEQFDNKVTVPFKKYIGYPTHSLADNIFGEQFTKKQNAFLEYGKFDGGVCHSVLQCSQTPTYKAYLKRQYVDVR